MTVSEMIVGKVSDFSYENIPAHVIKQAKDHLLDSIGVMLAASSVDSGENILNGVLELGQGDECLAIGSDKKVPAHLAALISGSLLHSLEYDDTHTDSIIHASSVVVPTALAVGEWQQSSGKDLLTSLVLGWETLIRFGLTAPGKFQSNGFHTTAVCGPFSASLIAGYLQKSANDQLVESLGICGSLSSGIFEYVTDGASIKQTHPGWAAHNGIIASRLVKHSIRGPYTVFEGNFGFYKNFTGQSEYGYEEIWDSFGKDWFLTELSYKPYPSCHFNHSFIDCAKDLGKQISSLEKIDQIICIVSKEIIPIVCEPWGNKIDPQTGYEAKFSLPYAVIAALVDGDVTLSSYEEEAIKRNEIKEMYQKVYYKIDEDSNFPQAFPGVLKIIMKNGQTFEKRIKYNRGGPNNPFSENDIIEKFQVNAEKALSPKKANQIMDIVYNLENIDNIADLSSLLKP